MTTTATSMPTRAQRVELILAHLKELPTLPAVATRILQMTSDSESNTREVVQLIESDPSLSAKLLSSVQRANSGYRSNAATVEKAVVMMGFEAVRNAVLTIKVFEAFGQPGDGQSLLFDRREFWKHSLAVACASRMLATHLSWGVDPEEAFVCGLLHDMGKVALDTCLPKSYDRVMAQAVQRRANIADVEKQLLGLDHAIAGRRLAQLWNLPAIILESVWLHHHPMDSLPASLSHAAAVRIVHLADVIARDMHVGLSGNFVFECSVSALAEKLEVPGETLGMVQNLLAPEIEDRAHLIGLDHLTTNELYLDALSKANQTLGSINERLATSNQRLRLRDRYLDALTGLNSELQSTDRPSRVCLAIGNAWHTAIGLPGIGVFARPLDDGICGYATVDETDRAEDLLAINNWADPDEDTAVEIDAAAMSGGLVSADSVDPQLLAVLGPKLGAGSLWMVPLVHDSTCVGGVLFSGDGNLLRGIQAQRNEVRMLAYASALMLANAITRQKAERLSDELSEANRSLQHAQQELLRKRSLSMIAEMAGGAAHEINNPLSVISGRAQLLSATTDNPELKEVLDLINTQSQKCSQIVSELMDFAKPRRPSPAKIDLPALLEGLRDDWLSRTKLRDDRISLNMPSQSLQVWADAEQLRCALDEIMSNAAAALDAKGSGRLEINSDLEPADGTVTVVIRDEGAGMTADVLEHAVDPFFSHRAAGRGRGLGLSRAVRWLEINGGQLRLESTPDAGTAVTVTLRTESAAPPA